jgi:hypothetical protein
MEPSFHLVIFSSTSSEPKSLFLYLFAAFKTFSVLFGVFLDSLSLSLETRFLPRFHAEQKTKSCLSCAEKQLSFKNIDDCSCPQIKAPCPIHSAFFAE